ncbi:MAG: hypothetical protein WCI57_04775 [Candidatus Berkelbacteria bacterium]
MKSNFLPKSKLAKWSVGLNSFFLLSMVVSSSLVLVFKVLSFDNHWWDITVAVTFPASIIALISGIIAKVKSKDRSALVSLSIFVGVLTVLFILLHSLFIND